MLRFLVFLSLINCCLRMKSSKQHTSPNIAWSTLASKSPSYHSYSCIFGPRTFRPQYTSALRSHACSSAGERKKGTTGHRWKHLIYSSPNTIYSSPNTIYSSPNTIYSSPNSIYSSSNSIYSSPNSVYSSPNTICLYPGIRLYDVAVVFHFGPQM